MVLINIIYSITILFVFYRCVLLFRKKHIITPSTALLLSISSLVIYWKLIIRPALFPSEVCDIDEGCLNEGGMIIILGLMLMFGAFLIVIIAPALLNYIKNNN